ncbi:Ctr copper transporter family-domain-containing protein [Chaetomium tenue]|uniref:Ctr copper transporter family-domain-containing protein n=1 Tax=Chaetomium tenue TaxID=1854479 RepID=A0ACB7PRL6_9PEZI|nr:Ctr copper transporter family-domain-containing protein [Chaetomium globosum]
MDHSSHDHHHMMDHSSHGGHGDSGPMCNMNMLFTWDTTDLCVVFRQWRITSTLSLVVSLVAVVAICAGYEALREGVRRYEAALSRRVDTAPRQNREKITRQAHVTKAVLYGIQNFYAFMIM